MLYDVIITLITTDTVSDCGRRSPLMFIDQHFEKKINSLSPEIPSRKPFLLYQCFYMCETKSLTVLQHAVCCDFFPVFFFLPGCPIIIVIFVCIFCLKKKKRVLGFVCLALFLILKLTVITWCRVVWPDLNWDQQYWHYLLQHASYCHVATFYEQKGQTKRWKKI